MFFDHVRSCTHDLNNIFILLSGLFIGVNNPFFDNSSFYLGQDDLP